MAKNYIQMFLVVLLGFLFFWITQKILSPQAMIAISFVWIALVGIPHGAIDHLLYKIKEGRLGPSFYIFYLGFMATYGLMWFFFPAWSLAFFMLLSIFHFGQSQFADYPKNLWTQWILPIVWGLCLLSGLVLLNIHEINQLQKEEEVREIFFIFHPTLIQYIFLESCLMVLVCFIMALKNGSLPLKSLLFESSLLIVLLIGFYLLDIMPGFTLYFAGVHSLLVMKQEYAFLKLRKGYSFGKFIGALAPFSLISIGASILLVYLSFENVLPIGNIKLLLILISLITLPHSLVMNKFYNR